MSTPSCSRSNRPGGLPLRRYLLTLPAAAIVFMIVAMVQERETFLPLFGIERSAPTGRDEAGARRAQALVLQVNRRLEAARTPADLAPLAVAPALREELGRALEFTRRRGEAPPRLARQAFVRVEPGAAGGWSVTTDETWTWRAPGGERRSRLRFRYTLARRGGGELRVEAMTPVLPEPVRGRPR